MKMWLRYITLILAVILATEGLTLLAISRQVLNPKLYTQALDQSKVYTITADILTTKATAYLIEVEKQFVADLAARSQPQNQTVAKIEPVAVWFLNSIIERQTGQVVQSVSASLEIDKTLLNLSDRGITAFILWLKGQRPDPKIFAYIPDPQNVEAVRSEGVVPFIAKQIQQNAGIADLPACSDNSQVVQNLKLVTQGKVSEITCYSPEIRTILDKTATAVAPKIAQTQLAINIQGWLKQYHLKEIADDLFNLILKVSQIKQNLYQFREAISLSLTVAWGSLGLALMLTVIGLILTEKRRLRTFFLTYLWVGGLMVLGSLIYMVTATQVIARSFPRNLQILSDPSVGADQKTQLVVALKMAATLIVKNWALSTLYAGLTISAVMLLGLLIMFLKVRMAIPKKPLK